MRSLMISAVLLAIIATVGFGFTAVQVADAATTSALSAPAETDGAMMSLDPCAPSTHDQPALRLASVPMLDAPSEMPKVECVRDCYDVCVWVLDPGGNWIQICWQSCHYVCYPAF